MADRSVFLDTNGWLALLNASDTLHSTAVSVWTRLGREGYDVLLTDWIVAETGNGLARTRARSQFPQAVAAVQRSAKARIVYVTPELLDRALAMYDTHQDKTWGLVDCVSFVVMSDEGIHEAFTTDHHFEQAGFSVLLK